MVESVIELLKSYDPEVGEAVDAELHRQRRGLELIASENLVSEEVMLAMATPGVNKYAEGYPGHRYYGGCECVDVVENIAIERACRLFGAEHANVQPHSGAQANLAVYLAFLKPGDTVMGMNLAHGGHLTHGSPVNMSGLIYNFVPYGVGDDGFIDYDAFEAKVREVKPKLVVAGASAYPRVIDFERMSKVVKEVGAIFMVDMAHIAGLCAAEVLPTSSTAISPRRSVSSPGVVAFKSGLGEVPSDMMTQSTGMVNSLPAISTGERLPLASGSPSSMRMHSMPFTQP